SSPGGTGSDRTGAHPGHLGASVHSRTARGPRVGAAGHSSERAACPGRGVGPLLAGSGARGTCGGDRWCDTAVGRVAGPQLYSHQQVVSEAFHSVPLHEDWYLLACITLTSDSVRFLLGSIPGTRGGIGCIAPIPWMSASAD